MANPFYPLAAAEPPRRNPIGLLVTALTINILLIVGLWLTSLLSTPYLPSFLWGGVEVARLMATGAPLSPQTELGRWYARYQEGQDGSLDRLTAVSDPLPLAYLTNPALYREAAERDLLRVELGAYVMALQTWDESSQQRLDSALSELEAMEIPPGSAGLVRSVIGSLEGEWIDRQSAWAAAESHWVTRVIDLYDWLEDAERRGAHRFDARDLTWLNGRDQMAYEYRLSEVDRSAWRATTTHQRLKNWSEAQNPAGLWQIFLNWFHGDGLLAPLAPEPTELLT